MKEDEYLKKTIADNKTVDLNSCYFPEEKLPDKFMGRDCLEKKNMKPVNMYLVAEDFTLLLMGDTAIKVKEHFKDSGKDMSTLMEENIIRENRKM